MRKKLDSRPTRQRLRTYANDKPLHIMRDKSRISAKLFSHSRWQVVSGPVLTWDVHQAFTSVICDRLSNAGYLTFGVGHMQLHAQNKARPLKEEHGTKSFPSAWCCCCCQASHWIIRRLGKCWQLKVETRVLIQMVGRVGASVLGRQGRRDAD